MNEKSEQNVSANDDKFGVCPGCKKKLTSLRHLQSGQNEYTFNGEDYTWKEFHPDSNLNVFECPECGVEIANDSDKATLFFKGECLDDSSETIEMETGKNPWWPNGMGGRTD